MIKLKKIHIKYDDKIILENEEITIPANKITIIKGESGSGKTALLYRLALISNDINYEYYFNNKNIALNHEHEKAILRKNNISFVLQESDMLPHLSVEETLFHYATISQIDLSSQEMLDLLAKMQIDVTLKQNIMTLSLGQRQRLAIACALIKKPSLLILDEPTASLDYENEILIYEILKSLSTTGITIIISAHSQYIDKYGDVIYYIRDKHIISDSLITGDDECTSGVVKKLPGSFYWSYIKKYIKYYQLIYILMIMVLTLSFMSCNTITTLIDNAADNSKSILTGQFDNKLIITNDKNNKYIDDDYRTFIKDFKYANAYPLYQITTIINNETIPIIPYFQEDNFGKYEESSFSNSGGMYIDNQSFYNLYYNDEKSPSIELELEIKNKQQTSATTIKSELSGVLKKNYTQHYSSNGDRFIYLPYSVIEDIAKSYIKDNEYIGYVVLFNSYEELKVAKSELEQKGFNINDHFTDIEAIDNIDQYYQQLKYSVIVFILVITVIIDFILSMQLYFKRRKEIILLKVNGLEKKHFIIMFLLELYLELMVVLILGLLIHLGILIIINDLTITNTIIVAKSLGIYLMVLTGTRCLSINLYLSRLKIETELRNS